MSLLSNLKIFVGILLGTTAFRGLRDKIDKTFVLSTGFMKKIFFFFIRKGIMKFVSRKFNCRLNRARSNYKIFVECSKLVMSSGLVNKILFSIRAEGTECKVLFRDITLLIPFQVFFKSLIFV